MNDQILNASEASVLADKAFYQIKAHLDLKIKSLLESLLPQLEQLSLPRLAHLPLAMQTAQSRFFQGELHEGFPWRAIDHRAVYGRDALLAFRCLIRYGGPLSLHWTLSGGYQARYAHVIATHAPALARLGFQLSLHDSPWVWSPDEAADAVGFRTLGLLSPDDCEQLFKERNFIKLSAFYPTDDFSVFSGRATTAWATLLDLLCTPDLPVAPQP